MQTGKIIKRSVFFILTVILIFAVTVSFCAETVYKKLIDLPTETVSGWKSDSATTVSVNTVKKGEKQALSFSSKENSLSGNFGFSAQWGEFDVDVSSLVLKTDIFVSDVSVLTRNGGSISLSGGGYAFNWKISDLSLESGWNSITLNLRTADISEPTVEKVETEPSEDAEDVESEETEEPEKTEKPTEEPTPKPSPDEILLLINKFSFEIEKAQSKELTVAFSGLSVSVPTQEEPPDPPKPITDEADQSLVIVAIVIAVLLIVAVFVYSAVYAKNEIKRRKREAKRRKREKMQEEQKNEE